MSKQTIAGAVSRKLFEASGRRVYAVLDGASIPDLALPQVLWEHEPEHVCLYRGELAPDVAATAPYLVALGRESSFTHWLINEGWGKHWGIFAVAPEETDLKVMRKHFRTFLMVMSPEGKPLYFRYYDPRVLRVFLPTCNAEETRTVFGPVQGYLLEGMDPQGMLVFEPADRAPRLQEVKLEI